MYMYHWLSLFKCHILSIHTPVLQQVRSTEMETNKKKYNLEIAGMPLTIVTDEPTSFVESIVNRLDERITEMTQSNYRISTLDACLLCAIDYLGDKMKAEKRIRNLEAQISLYEDNIQRLNDELDEAKAQLENKASSEPAEENQRHPPRRQERLLLRGQGPHARKIPRKQEIRRSRRIPDPRREDQVH